jgi:NAD(P)H-dependent flavin oxidoreductase YrpB (nitropropane dioxygenase family)
MSTGIGAGVSPVFKLKPSGLTPVQKIVNAFKARVLAAGGVFEAKACLDAQLTILSNIE